MGTSRKNMRRDREAVSCRHCERSEAIHAATSKQVRKMDCFAALAMTVLGYLTIEFRRLRLRLVDPSRLSRIQLCDPFELPQPALAPDRSRRQNRDRTQYRGDVFDRIAAEAEQRRGRLESDGDLPI